MVHLILCYNSFMLHFENDYNQGAHPALLQALLETNEESLAGYGMDFYTQAAIEAIRSSCQCPEAQISFLSGGTQTNQVVIASLLQSYEGVIAADTGHIAQHEAGAIELTGHKVLALSHEEGKIKAVVLEQFLEDFYADANHAHMVFPGMVYLSHPTEYGTLYSKAELEEIAAVCKTYDLPLFVDGARLGYALASKETDVDLPTLASLVDVFYIGGTKLGALLGEAVVFTKKNQPKNFMTIVKQHGALLAKGRLLGVQFHQLFKGDLYLKLGQHGIEMAEILKQILEEKGYTFYLKSPTNQQFIIVDNAELASWKAKGIGYSFWEKYDDASSIVRLATSWSTTREDLDELAKVL